MCVYYLNNALKILRPKKHGRGMELLSNVSLILLYAGLEGMNYLITDGKPGHVLCNLLFSFIIITLGSRYGKTTYKQENKGQEEVLGTP